MHNPTSIIINGYDTYFTEAENDIGKYLLIAIPPHADYSFSDICNSFINGHLITQVDYYKTDGKITHVMAYY